MHACLSETLDLYAFALPLPQRREERGYTTMIVEVLPGIHKKRLRRLGIDVEGCADAYLSETQPPRASLACHLQDMFRHCTVQKLW